MLKTILETIESFTKEIDKLNRDQIAPAKAEYEEAKAEFESLSSAVNECEARLRELKNEKDVVDFRTNAAWMVHDRKKAAYEEERAINPHSLRTKILKEEVILAKEAAKALAKELNREKINIDYDVCRRQLEDLKARKDAAYEKKIQKAKELNERRKYKSALDDTRLAAWGSLREVSILLSGIPKEYRSTAEFKYDSKLNTTNVFYVIGEVEHGHIAIDVETDRVIYSRLPGKAHGSQNFINIDQ